MSSSVMQNAEAEEKQWDNEPTQQGKPVKRNQTMVGKLRMRVASALSTPIHFSRTEKLPTKETSRNDYPVSQPGCQNYPITADGINDSRQFPNPSETGEADDSELGSRGPPQKPLSIQHEESTAKILRPEKPPRQTSSAPRCADAGSGGQLSIATAKIQEDPQNAVEENTEEGHNQPLQQTQLALEQCSWYHQGMSRDEATALMRRHLSQDGAFLVRSSERGGCQFPFVLCVNKDGELFNIQIGVRGRGPMEFALGSERQDELRFSSIPDLIDGYHTHQLELFRNGQSVGFVTLKSG